MYIDIKQSNKKNRLMGAAALVYKTRFDFLWYCGLRRGGCPGRRRRTVTGCSTPEPRGIYILPRNHSCFLHHLENHYVLLISWHMRNDCVLLISCHLRGKFFFPFSFCSLSTFISWAIFFIKYFQQYISLPGRGVDPSRPQPSCLRCPTSPATP